MHIPRKICLILILAIGMAAVADPTIPDSNTVVFSMYSMPENLDVFTVIDTTAQEIFRLMYDGLFEIGPQTDALPNLAESWDISPDGLIWTFAIQKGITFHDGSILSADDVAYSYERLLSPDVRHVFGGQFEYIESIEASDEYTFVVRLKYPYPDVLNTLTRHIAPRPRETSSNTAQLPNGTGPYVFSRQTDDEIVLSTLR